MTPITNKEPGDVIQDIQQECIEFGTLIDDTKDSSSQTNSHNNISTYWDLKQKEFDTYLKSKQDDMDRQQQAIDTKINNYGSACEASKTAFNQELDHEKSLRQQNKRDSQADHQHIKQCHDQE